jgi:hypothetical protein
MTKVMAVEKSLVIPIATRKSECNCPGSEPVQWEDVIDLRGDVYKIIHAILVELWKDTNAHYIFLIDVEGRTIDRVGNAAELPMGQIASLLGSHSVSVFEVGRLNYGEKQAAFFIYLEGEWEDICMIKVGRNIQLVIGINKDENSGRMGSLYFFGRKAAMDIARELEPMHVHHAHEEVLIKNVIIKEADQLLERS